MALFRRICPLKHEWSRSYVAYIKRPRAASPKTAKPKPAKRSVDSEAGSSKTRSRLVAIEKSEEAQRQNNAGSYLDSDPATPVPILEYIFDDADLFTKENDQLRSAKRPFVTPETPFIESALDVRGVNSNFVNQIYRSRLYDKHHDHSISTELLRGIYFPPWHAIASARKSRPALLVTFGKGMDYNGASIADKKKRHDEKSVNPFHYVVWRLKTSRRMRTAFARAWIEDKEAADGLYMVTAQKVPMDRERLYQDMKKLIKVAKRESSDKGNQIDLASLNECLIASHYQMAKMYKREDWEKAMRREP